MKFWHNGVLTPDIDKTIDFLSAASSTQKEKWTILEAEFPQSNMAVGEGGKLRIAMGKVGGIAIELLQPLDDLSYHAKALKARGPGFHHNAYVCEDNQEEVLAALLAAGGRIVWDFNREDERAFYVEADGGNAVLEIINVCPFMPED